MSSSEAKSEEAPQSVEIPPQSPFPKKRGRKRKSEISVRELEENMEIIPKEETVSRRGRPRKKVNYYELANPDNVDLSVPKFFNVENDEPRVYKKKQVVEKEKNESSISEVSRIEEKSEINNYSNGRIAEDSLVSEKAQDNSLIEDSTINLEATTSTPNPKDKRYCYTGETVKMMNTLFSLFTSNTLEEKNAQDIANNSTNNTNGTLPSSNNKRPYRRKQKVVIKEEDIDDGTGNITCAICNQTLDKNLWSHHKQRYHNNLAWRVGDPPLDLNDQSFVMHTLNALYKKKKPLYCDKCGEVKKSVVGFLSHRSQCLKSEEQLESVKIACEICGRKMLPVSMSTHLKMLHTNNPDKEESLDRQSPVVKPLPSKRSAAKKAMRIIEHVTKDDKKGQYFTSNLDLGAQDFARELLEKELNETQFIECKFRCNCITTNMEDALKHMEECSEKLSEGFVCKQCLRIQGRLEDMIYHIEFTHSINIAVDDDQDFNEKDNKLPSFLYTTIRRTERVLFPHAFDWTLKFTEENFSETLHEDLINDSPWPLLPPNQVPPYLPRLSQSCDLARIQITNFINPLNSNYDFKKYDLFESEVHEDDNKITLFCGGPISAMAWLPTPCTKLEENQVLAVSVLNSPDEKYTTSENNSLESCIQFWNFGVLKSREKTLVEPKLAFSLAHNHGPVWHLEFCPSGCYNEGQINRMGLVAVAGSDSVVYIYSIPFFTQDSLYYKPKSVMKLLLQRPESVLLGGLKYYPTKISWSKAKGHDFVAVGYSNGFIALFNIKCSSFLLKFEDPEGVVCILPYKSFQGHSHAITALDLYHLNGGNRWLLSGSVDRAVSLWDLSNHSYPICSLKKNIVTDGFWMSNWLAYVTASDEGSTSTYVTAMLKQARDYLYDPNVTLTCSPSTISAVSGSDWLNGIVHANAVGEIVALFPHQIFQIPEHQKVLKTKRMLFGYAYLIEKSKTPGERVEDQKIKKKTLQNLLTKKMSAGVKLSKIKADIECDNLFVNEPVLYSEAEEKYGLLFCDNKMETYENFPKSAIKELSALSKTYGITAPNQYPLLTINKIVFNPNRQASLYYATGYQAGFVRLTWMKFLKNDQQIK